MKIAWNINYGGGVILVSSYDDETKEHTVIIPSSKEIEIIIDHCVCDQEILTINGKRWIILFDHHTKRALGAHTDLKTESCYEMKTFKTEQNYQEFLSNQ